MPLLAQVGQSPKEEHPTWPGQPLGATLDGDDLKSEFPGVYVIRPA